MRVRSVIVLNDFCHVQGGASRVAVDEAISLRKHGLDVTFLGAVGPVSAELMDADIRTVCLDQPELAEAAQRSRVVAQTLWNQKAYRAMQTLLSENDPQHSIVHLHGYTKALTTTPALAASRADFPIICTLHDFFAACPNGAFFDYRRQAPCRLRGLSASCVLTNCDKRHAAHKAYRVVRGVAQRRICRFPASVRDYITLSDQSAEILRPYLPKSARFHALANIIDIPRASPVDAGANQVFVVVGRLDPEKGVLLAAEAAARADVPIVFVGDGPLRRDIEATGARVTGWLSKDRVQEEIAQARCLVFPSLWYETYGLVVAEAAARGVPAIVSDVSAPAERIANGSSGWVFQSGNLDSLLHRMSLARDPIVARAAGITAYRRYWADPSDRERHAALLANIYDAVIARSERSVACNVALSMSRP
jgi:glycosyltransferase involved in cell wall biosynthesis